MNPVAAGFFGQVNAGRLVNQSIPNRLAKHHPKRSTGLITPCWRPRERLPSVSFCCEYRENSPDLPIVSLVEAWLNAPRDGSRLDSAMRAPREGSSAGLASRLTLSGWLRYAGTGFRDLRYVEPLM